MDERLDILMVSEGPLWPLDQGYRIRGYKMAEHLSYKGLRCAIASMTPPPSGAPESLREMTMDWPTTSHEQTRRFLDGWSGLGYWARMKLASHQALDVAKLAGVIPLVDRHQPRAVIGLGQHSPLMLAALKNRQEMVRVWYAADEPIHFHLSCMGSDKFAQLPLRLWKILVYAGLERLFVRRLDGVIGVNPTDTQWLRRLSGVRDAITIRNGVDFNYYHPGDVKANGHEEETLVFWGRLDFDPNIDAVTWFARRVWPTLKSRHPNAKWKIIGKNPVPQVQALESIAGIELLGQVDDIRPHARSAAAVVLPMRRGGGIKNKLLEAAAMARPIIASPRAVEGLVFDGRQQPILVCSRRDQWCNAIERVWENRAWATQKGQRSLAWVRARHSWRRAAGSLAGWLEQLRGQPWRLATPISVDGVHPMILERQPDPVARETSPSFKEAA